MLCDQPATVSESKGEESAKGQGVGAESVPLPLGDSWPVRVLLVSLARTESYNYARLHEDKERDCFITRWYPVCHSTRQSRTV